MAKNCQTWMSVNFDWLCADLVVPYSFVIVPNKCLCCLSQNVPIEKCHNKNCKRKKVSSCFIEFVIKFMDDRQKETNFWMRFV